jgi:hypothetical protein
MTRRAVRGRRGEKGGSDTASAIGPEAADHRLERGDLVAEAKGDRFERLALNEHGAEGLILAVEGLLRLEEELAVVAPLHDAGSLRFDYFLARNRRGAYPQNRGRTRVETTSCPRRTGKTREKPTGRIETLRVLRMQIRRRSHGVGPGK